MPQNNTVIGIVGCAAFVGITLVSAFSLFYLGLGMCLAGPTASEAGRFCDSWHFPVYLLGLFAVPSLCVLAGTVWALVRETEAALAVGIAVAALVLIIAPTYPASLSTECDYPGGNSELCETD
jgi:hypothetical protein